MSPAVDPPGVRITAVPTPHRVRPGDDLAEVFSAALEANGVVLADGDVVCVASKVVSLAEGAVAARLPGEDDATARRRIARQHAAGVVAEAPQVLVTRTRHGFVAANGGVDASNVTDADTFLLLPDDPDGSADRLRTAIAERHGVTVGVVVTDTFGRPWRLGQTDVALGVSGVTAIRDERGGHDLDGRRLEVTEVAVADEVAAAADLVRDKGSGTPFVVVRGVPGGRHGTGADLVRPPTADLFAAGGPTAALRSVQARRTVRRFAVDRPVPTAALTDAVAAAVTAPAPHGTRPWRFARLTEPRRSRVLDAMAARWRGDLNADGVAEDVITRRLARSDAVLRPAPELLFAFVVLEDAHDYPDQRRSTAERDLFVLSGGAALQSLQVVLAAHGVGTAWISSTAFCPEVVRAELELPATWAPIGAVAAGFPEDPPPPREPADPTGFLRTY